jgi:hypothetical protein
MSVLLTRRGPAAGANDEPCLRDDAGAVIRHFFEALQRCEAAASRPSARPGAAVPAGRRSRSRRGAAGASA